VNYTLLGKNRTPLAGNKKEKGGKGTTEGAFEGIGTEMTSRSDRLGMDSWDKVAELPLVDVESRKADFLTEEVSTTPRNPRLSQATNDHSLWSESPKHQITYGTWTGGLELMRAAWPNLDHKWALRTGKPRDLEECGPLPPTILWGGRVPKRHLEKHPVDLLVVERGSIRRPDPLPKVYPWEAPTRHVDPQFRPMIIIESWRDQAVTWVNGPADKSARTRWHELGYETRVKRVQAIGAGAALDQRRSLVVRIRREHSTSWKWGHLSSYALLHPRPMSNLLTPPGLLRRQLRVLSRGSPPTKARIPIGTTNPMPSLIDAWIRPDPLSPPRRLTSEEVGKGLGLPKGWAVGDTAQINPVTTTCVFIWEYVSQSLLSLRYQEKPLRPASLDLSLRDRANNVDYQVLSAASAEADGMPTKSPIDWAPPSLEEGGKWNVQRIKNLRRAAATTPDPSKTIVLGLEDLARHRRNYNSTGTCVAKLQLLWWEFPPEHWDALREGSRMNFLTEPSPAIHPNADMDAEQRNTAATFVDELVAIGAIGPPDPDFPVVTTAPLFCVPKPGQPGQWRVISDMKTGGQNGVVGADPVFLPRATHILEEMYAGGYTAIVDASKFFYQFGTHPDDQPHLGVVHPITAALLVWLGLPMGSGNSPALAGKYGLAFLRLLRERAPDLFGDHGEANCFWSGFKASGKFEPKHGYGFVLKRPDGTLGARVWVFVDDFAIHGAAEEIANEAVQLFFDVALEVGLLCNPVKCHPPAQVCKYLGFLFDTRGIPILRIPEDKRERGIAMLEHTLGHPSSWEFSRLSLSVLVGTLESMSEATPLRMGHTRLRRLHAVVHPPGLGSGIDPYLTCTTLTPSIRRDLDWWLLFLRTTQGKRARTQQSGTLIPCWGDGSGTGTGGTLGLPDQPLSMWMGQWDMIVYKFSSNWKELKTLELTLRQILASPTQAASARGSTLFYFTDNSTTYWVAAAGSSRSPGLHALIENIRRLELTLDCSLVVVHVPGVVMIQQGTDGLSRGVWATPYHDLHDSNLINRWVFEPLSVDTRLVAFYIRLLRVTGGWRLQPWDSVWSARALFNTTSVWFPPPELARQAITFMLNAWVEQPLTTGALFFVPRVLPGFWHGLSRYIREVALIRPDDPPCPLQFPPKLPIPIVVLYLAPHVRTLPDSSLPHRLGPSPSSANLEWHHQQADLMRGMSPSD